MAGLVKCAARVVVVLVLARLHAPYGTSSEPVANSSAATNTAQETPEDSLRTGQAFAVGQRLKQIVRNPDSLVIEQANASDDGKLLCVTYRAQNGFGGMNRETGTWYDGAPHPDAAYWNKHCTQPMRDVTFVVQAGTRH